MSVKQNQQHTIDIFSYALIICVLLIVWSASQSLSLLVPITSLSRTSSVERVSTSTVTQPSPEFLQLKAMQELRSDLQGLLSTFTKEQPNEFGIYVRHLASGIEAGSNSEVRFITASLYKPFAVIEALKMVDNGQISLETPLAGTGSSIRECIWATITVSDNPCGRALRNLSGIGTPQGLASLRTDGYKDTDLRGDYPLSTAQDVGLMLEHIYNADILSQSSNQLLLDALLAQQINDRLPIGLAPGSELAHKTGDLEGAAHDAGIVFRQDNDYIVVVMSGADYSGQTLDERYQEFSNLMTEIESVITDYQLIAS